MGVERSTQAIAEEAARRAGMSLANWLDEVVAEQATDQGVAAEDLTEEDRLDAIGERLDQLSRREADQPPAPRRRDRPRDENFAHEGSSAEREIAEARLEAAMAKFDLRASRNEQRTAKALESVAQWIERSETERAKETARREIAEHDASRRERVVPEPRDAFDERPAPSPRRAEPDASRGAPRSRRDLQDAVARIHRRRGELDARQGLGARPAPPRPAPRAEIEEPPAATSRVAAFPAQPRQEPEPVVLPRPQTQVSIDWLRDEIAGLNARLDQFGRERTAPAPAPVAPPADRRLTSAETEALRAELTAMRRALTELAPRNANVALEGAVVDLGQRLEAMRKGAINGDALRPLEEMLLQLMELLRRQDPQSAAKSVENDLKGLSARIDALTRAAVDPAVIDQIRRQTEDVRQMLAKAAEGAPLAKLERQIEQLANRTDRLGAHPTPQPEIERLIALFAETRTQIERAVSPVFLKTVEQRLESLSTRIDDALKRPAQVFDPRPIEELARRFDTLKTVVEKQAEVQPAGAKLEAALAEIGRKLDRPLPTPTLDIRPFEDLARRVDHLKSAFDRQATVAPTNPKWDAALADIGRKLDRPAPIPALDARPFEEIARRVEGLKSVVERQAVIPAATARLEVALAEIGQKLERLSTPPSPDSRSLEDLARRFESLRNAVERQAANPASNAKLEAALAEIGQKLERVAAAAPPPTLDTRPIEDLSRRFETLRGAVERQAATTPANAKLEAALAEIGQKLERMAAAPTLDTRPIEDLSRGFETLRGAVERQAAATPGNAKLEAALAEIAEKLERVAAAPTLDTRPIEDLSRRFETLRGAVERQAAATPANANLESALAELSRKLDRPVPAPEFDTRPLEDLAQQMEGLKAAVELQAEAAQGGKLEAAIAEIGRKLDRPPQGLADQMAIKSTLQALSARVEDGFRKIGSAPPDSGKSVGALELELLDEIARGLEDMRGSIGRQGDFSASAIRLEAAIADLSNRMESANEPASDRAALNDTLQMLLSRLRDWAPAPAPVGIAEGAGLQALTSRFDALHASLASHAEIVPQLSNLTAELAEIREHMGAQGQSSDDTRALIDIVQDLSNKIDQKDSSASDLRALETLAREVLARPMRVDTSSIESMIGELGHKIDAAAGANFDLGPLVDWMSRIDSRLESVDPAPFEQAIRDLGERIDAREPAGLDSGQIEQAAELIAQRLEPRSSLGVDAELLLQQISEIHERLDGLGGGSSSTAALEKSVAELATEFESTRQLLASVIEPAAQAGAIIDDIADLKAEHVNAERRMSTRLTRVQEILEQLSDRLRLIEEGQDDQPRPTSAQAQAPAAASGFDFNEIPDRPRSAVGRPVPAPVAPPQAARPMAEPGGFLLEPGAGAPRGTAKKPEEPRRAAAEANDPAQSTDLQAHIAAARRAAMAEMNARREQSGASAESAAKRAGSPTAALKQAQSVVAGRRVPFLIGATLLVAAATAAVFEMRGGHLPLIQKSEIAPVLDAPLAQAPAPAPAAEVAIKDVAPSAAPKIDYAPTGAVNPTKPAEDAAKANASAARVPADLVAAFPEGQPDSLKTAALAGDALAETELGLRYVEGRALTRDPKTGARWLELAANQGATYAQYRLGALYERGVGVGKDAPLARAWYKKAADGGNARAMHNLAVMDAEDAGAGKPDYVEAAAGFRAAGEFGVRDSQYNLGVLYGRGLGIPQDLAQSWMWFSLAAQQGDADAGKKRDEVSAKLDAKQLAAATKALADFKLKTPAPVANEAPQPPGGWETKAPAPQAAKPAAPAASPTPTAPAVKG